MRPPPMLPRAILGLLSLIALQGCAADEGTAGARDDELSEAMGWSGASSEMLGSPEHDIRLAAIREMAEVSDPLVVPFLTEALSDVDLRVRRDAAEALGRQGDEAGASARALGAALDDPSAIVRSRALWALSEIGGRQAAEVLRAHLAGVDPAATDQVLIALGGTGEASVIDDIAPYVHDQDPFVRRAAMSAMLAVGARAMPAFRQLLRDSDPAIRCEAARALAMLGAEGSLAEVREIAQDDDDPRVRICAAGAQARLGERQAIEPLLRSLEAPDPALRGLAAEALGLAGGTEAATALIAALEHFPSGRDEPNAAIRALIELGDVGRLAMRGALEEASNGALAALARGLAVVGSEDDLDALREQVGRARGESAEALNAAISAIALRLDR